MSVLILDEENSTKEECWSSNLGSIQTFFCFLFNRTLVSFSFLHYNFWMLEKLESLDWLDQLVVRSPTVL